jgi:hypothetical protein
VEVPQDVVEQFTDQFTVKNFKEDIASVFPVLYRLMKESEIGYDDIVEMTAQEETHEETINASYEDPFMKFEAWAMGLGEDSAITSEDPEEQQTAIQGLQELVGQEFPAGVDGTNAIESLKGMIEDPELFKRIKGAATEDANADVRQLVQDWLNLNAPEALEQLDFGDLAAAEPEGEAPATDQGGDITAPEAPAEEPAAEVPAEEPVPQESREDGKKKTMDVQGLAEFIHSFYDKESGTFPKGPEGVAIMVGKKFGEQAEMIARKMVERMAPQQQDPTVNELSRIKELARW